MDICGGVWAVPTPSHTDSPLAVDFFSVDSNVFWEW